MIFDRRKPALKTKQASLSAKPLRLVDAALETTADGGGKLKVKLKQTRFGWWLLKLPEGATKTFELDALGRFVWEQADGKTSVQQIIRRLSKRYTITLREAEVSTTQFLQMLAKKGLIGLSIDK